MPTEASIPLLSKELDDAEPSLELERARKSTRGRSVLAIFGFSACVFLLSLRQTWYTSKTCKTCKDTSALPVTAPRHNVWKNLDIDEAAQVRSWLYAPERGLNLTKAALAGDSDNWIHVVEASKPPKASALAFLSDPSNVVDKYAHAIIHHGKDEKIVDYLIGPLPISPSTTIRPLSENYHNPVPLNARSTFNWTAIASFASKLLAPLNDATMDLFNGTVADKTLAAAGQGPMSYDGAWRRSWLQLRRNIPGSWLHGLDFYLYVDISGTDPSKYKLISIVHKRVLYNSVEAFLEVWKNGTLSPTILTDTSNWASRAPRGQRRDLDDRAGPRSVQFDGPRYRLDREEGYVTWMGWSFYTSFERDMGLHLWDINFRGERIIYELSPQEAMAQYTGDDPHQASTVWLDSAFGMGGNVKELILGYDCPHDAMLLDATIHESGSTTRYNAICIFEREGGRPLSRHTGMERDEMGVVKGYELVVRTISTVGNYDYLFDYTFQLDGTIEIRLSASGYLQGGVWNEDQAAYGHRIHHTSMGTLHDHVINFKVDFDIAGTENSLLAVTLEMEDKDEPWFGDDWGQITRQQRINRTMIPKESLLDYPQNMEGAYVILNQNSTNAWGNPRGYTIHPGPLCKLRNLENKRTERSVEWAKHHLGISRRKDNEPKSSSMWNMNLPGKPPVDFGKFFDNESIEQEDLVAWVNLGTHHIPRAEDSPNTLTNVATSYVLLVPWNYNDYDVSLESQNHILLNHAKGKWEISEPNPAKTCLPPRIPQTSYRGVQGYTEEGEAIETGGEEGWREERWFVKADRIME